MHVDPRGPTPYNWTISLSMTAQGASHGLAATQTQMLRLNPQRNLRSKHMVWAVRHSAPCENPGDLRRHNDGVTSLPDGMIRRRENRARRAWHLQSPRQDHVALRLSNSEGTQGSWHVTRKITRARFVDCQIMVLFRVSILLRALCGVQFREPQRDHGFDNPS